MSLPHAETTFTFSTKPILTIAETAMMLDRHPATIRRWIASGQLPYIRLDARSLYVPLQGLLALTKSQVADSAS